jgi:acyl-CoA reductase-like NAD-dependent aldehyde dehydrogenase
LLSTCSLNMPAIDDQLLFIDGENAVATRGQTFTVVNPMTGLKLYDAAAATVPDYDTAIKGAQAALDTWASHSATSRRKILLKAADLVESERYAQEAMDLMSLEISAPKSWCITNIKGTAGFFREAASLATYIRGEVVPVERPDVTGFIERRPVGVVLAISPWNAPMILTARAMATPLICGNTVVLKPSEFSPRSQGLVIRALVEAGLPAGCVQYLPTSPADAPEVTEYAIKHPDVRKINFTGSDRVGRIIAGIAATQLKQCVLELGGKAPVIILEDADVPKAVEAVVYGAFAFNGQVCMSTERVIVHSSIYVEFRTLLLQRVGQIRSGNHLEAGSDTDVPVTGLYTPSSAQRVVDLIHVSLADGAKLIAGDLSISGPNQTILQPHVLEDVEPSMDIFQEETFAPVLTLSVFESEEQAVNLANSSDYSMVASVFSRDTMRPLRIARKIRSGTCHVNSPTVYMESTLPQGGIGGGSGYGRFGGMAGVEEFTHRQIITLAEPADSYSL